MPAPPAFPSPDPTCPGTPKKVRGPGALPVTQKAVEIHQELAAASPGRYRPGLARSLTRLAEFLTELGRTAEAEKIRAEAGS